MLRARFILAALIAAVLNVPAAAAQIVCPQGRLDDCYTRDSMEEFARVAVAMVDDYVARVNGDVMPSAVYVVETAEPVEDGCEGFAVNGVADSMSFFFCPVDNSIYLGLDQLWEFYDQHGAASPVIAIAHEYGHLMQYQAGVPEPESFEKAIDFENQADCVAGAFAADLETTGSLEPRDLTNLDQFLRSIGSAEGPTRDHGTPKERIDAFEAGFQEGIPACNAMTPRTPLTNA